MALAQGALVQRAVFSILFLAGVALAAVLSARHPVAVDWTASGRNTLSPASRELLARMPGRIHVRAFVSDDRRMREAVRQLVGRYRRAHARVDLQFINPDREPRESERFGIRQEGELVLEYEDRRENVQGLSEAVVSNALARLARAGERWLAFTTGHGEREFLGNARSDLGQFAQHLKSLGYTLQPLDPATLRVVPDNVAVLVVQQPREALSAAAQAVLVKHLDQGGNLLWLADPDGTTPPALAQRLGVDPEPGMLVDPSSRLNGQSTSTLR